VETKKFTDLIVWQKAHRLFLDIVKDVEVFPDKRAARIISDQVLRSGGSVSANIAEGYGRHKGKEYEHYLIVARGSLTETENWLIKCKDLGYMGMETFEVRVKIVEEIVKMLNTLIGKVRSSNIK